MRRLVLLFALSLSTSLHADVTCPDRVAVSAPPFACRRGSATVTVAPVDGAAYAWIATGATIASGNGTPRVVLTFDDAATAHVVAAVRNGNCTSTGEADIALRDAFAVKVDSEGGREGEPMTIRWSFSGGEPAAQTLSGTDFPDAIALPPGARSYTYTPSAPGLKDASIAASMVPASRHRAVGGNAGASSCSSARSSASYQVAECLRPSLAIRAPSDVLHGSTFEAYAVTDATSVHWTITNGTPATADGMVVTIRAGDAGAVKIAATGERGNCRNVGSSSTSANIVQQLACDHPVATVGIGAIDCLGGTVNVRFAGTPPFTGKWSDGINFSTDGTNLTRRFNVPGTYTIASFQDATCAGTVEGAAVFPFFGLTAKLTQTKVCAGDTMTLQVTGTPPFNGAWSDLVPFNTSQTSITRMVPSGQSSFGVLFVEDAKGCFLNNITGAQVSAKPVITLHADNGSADLPVDPKTNCFFPAPNGTSSAKLVVDFTGGSSGPRSVTWSDGPTSTASPGSSQITRLVQPSTTTTYSVTSATDANCSALAMPSLTLWVSPQPDVVVSSSICNKTAATARLNSAPPAGAAINWTVQNGTITGGQGTSTVSFTTGPSAGQGTVTAAFSFTDSRCPISTTKTFTINGCTP